jgi:hypothetical protein
LLLSEAAKDVKIIVMVLQSLGIKVKTPIIIKVDNIEAIFMAENVSTTSRTKHIDIRYHFVIEFVVDDFVKIVFVKTTETNLICLQRM